MVKCVAFGVTCVMGSKRICLQQTDLCVLRETAWYEGCCKLFEILVTWEPGAFVHMCGSGSPKKNVKKQVQPFLYTVLLQLPINITYKGYIFSRLQ